MAKGCRTDSATLYIIYMQSIFLYAHRFNPALSLERLGLHDSFLYTQAGMYSMTFWFKDPLLGSQWHSRRCSGPWQVESGTWMD